MESQFMQQLAQWHEENEFQKIVDAILEIPENERDYSLTSQLARAMNNLSKYDEAIAYLLSVKDAAAEDALWHYRLAYAYFYKCSYQEAIPVLEREQEIDPTDEDGLVMLARCYRAVNDREHFHAASDRLRELAPETWGRYFGVTNSKSVPYEKEDAALNKTSKYDTNFRKALKKRKKPVEVYTEEELDVLEKHIAAHFGAFDNVYHEISSPDIHVDIAIINPSPERNYYTLLTMGMGAHRMKVPREVRDDRVDRAEIVVCLPPDWDIQNGDEHWYWPLRWLKILARLPIEEHSWLGWGHSVTNEGGAPFAENTMLSGVMLDSPKTLFGEPSQVCEMPDGSCVRFYQMIPVYREEMDYKIDNSAEVLFEKLGEDFSPVLDLQRENSCMKIC